MTITLRLKDLEGDNKSIYLDIYDKGKRKLAYLSLYLLPEIDAEIKARNEATIARAQQIRAECILHPEYIDKIECLTAKQNNSKDESIEVMDWIQTYIDWMNENADYSSATVRQSCYLRDRLSDFLKAKHKPHILLRKFDKKWFKEFFLWLQNDYIPHKYVHMESKPLCQGTLNNLQRRLVAIFNKAVRNGKLRVNPFYQLEKSDTFHKVKTSHKQFLTPSELKQFMASEELSPGVAETQRAFGFACLTGLRISDIKALKWSDIKTTKGVDTLIIVQKKTKTVNAVPICATAKAWMPERGKSAKVFSHLPAIPNIDAALKRIAKRAGIEKNISFHTSRHTFGTLIQAVTGDIETTKKLMGHNSINSTLVYADVLTKAKSNAINNTDTVFKNRKRHVENETIPKTKRTAATITNPRKNSSTQHNKE